MLWNGYNDEHRKQKIATHRRACPGWSDVCHIRKYWFPLTVCVLSAVLYEQWPTLKPMRNMSNCHLFPSAFSVLIKKLFNGLKTLSLGNLTWALLVGGLQFQVKYAWPLKVPFRGTNDKYTILTPACRKKWQVCHLNVLNLYCSGNRETQASQIHIHMFSSCTTILRTTCNKMIIRAVSDKRITFRWMPALWKFMTSKCLYCVCSWKWLPCDIQ